MDDIRPITIIDCSRLEGKIFRLQHRPHFRPVFSVQYHPEASPGPRDSHYLFTRFADMMRQAKNAAKRKIA